MRIRLNVINWFLAWFGLVLTVELVGFEYEFRIGTIKKQTQRATSPTLTEEDLAREAARESPPPVPPVQPMIQHPPIALQRGGLRWG